MPTECNAVERVYNAQRIACPLLYRPTDPAYGEDIRNFQGCPTIAVTRGGRIYLAWYSGGIREPHIENYNLVIYSDDKGATWSDPLLVIPSSRALWIHALDVQLFTDPDGRLHIYWVQNNACPAPEVIPEAKPGQPIVAVEGVLFDDFTHAMWETVCDDPDADEPHFSPARFLDIGFLRCKPLVTASGRWIACNYDQVDPRYGYSISDDGGKSFSRRYGPEKIPTPFDETMCYERRDGSIRMLARSGKGELGECYSYDGGLTFGEASLSGIDAPNTRFFVGRLPSGRLLLVKNDDRTVRRNMTACLSEDDGVTWPYKALIDARPDVSYPDVDLLDGKILLTYDRERTKAKEILFVAFTEEDIINGTIPAPGIVSKPAGAPK